MKLQLQKPEHIIIYVSDLERSAAFYRDVLGLELKALAPGWAEFETGSTSVILHRTAEKQIPFHHGRPRAGQAQLSFLVDDLEEIYAELRQQDVYISLAPQKQPSGVLLAVINDPDGFGINLQQR